MKHKELTLKHLKGWQQELTLDTADSDFDIRSFYKSQFDPNKCKSTHCAIGYLASLPEFNRLGFQLEQTINGASPTYKDYTEVQAIEQFFKLEERQVVAIFYPHTLAESPTTLQDVIDKIEVLDEA